LQHDNVSWSTHDAGVADVDQESLILVHGLPWPCGLPSPNGEVTHVVMLRPSRTGELELVSRLDLPGLGDIGATSNSTGKCYLKMRCVRADKSRLLHLSLNSYCGHILSHHLAYRT
jgi:hypothetical protein